MAAENSYYSRIPINKVNHFENLLSRYEISDETQVGLLKASYLAFWGCVWCLSWNFLVVTNLWFEKGDASKTKAFILAFAYMTLGIPTAFVSWFRSLWEAFRTGDGAMFEKFFVFSLVHIGLCIFASVAPPVPVLSDSLTGFFSALHMFYDGPGVYGFLYYIGAVLFGLEAGLSIWLLNRVNAYYRERGLFLEMV
ncbi:hypothetical protein Tsubulata_034103 [Turnera subulata]|uniref:Secretory carrier-associated membrane protein n=1 Tax=Turnera subulata TaxID=218843 RepID=A0A9Q0G5E9_9ROSI|nr:hypothetical protein Tsubulata_034103 [Turnera subulata]